MWVEGRTVLRNKKIDEDALTQALIRLIEERKPQNVEQLVEMLQQKTSIPKIQIIKQIIKLQSQGKILLVEPLKQPPLEFFQFLQTKDAYWYWITIITAAVAGLSAFLISENAYPLVYVRYVLGAVSIFWLPGHSFIRALLPNGTVSKTKGENSEFMERAALSIGMSLTLVAIVGLLLNYTSWGIRLTPIIASLVSLTIIFATAAIIRERKIKTEKLWKSGSES